MLQITRTIETLLHCERLISRSVFIYTLTHNQKDNRTMTKTFTAQEAIDITYDHGTSSTSKGLDDFMR